jgi:integrase
MPVYSKQTKAGTRWYVSMRAEGRKVYPSGAYPTRAAATLALQRLQVAKADGEYRAPDGRTVDGFLSWWIDSHKELRPRTAERYRTVARLHIFPLIGSMPLQKVGPEDVQRVIDAAEASSVYTAQKVANILRTAFGRAVKLGHVRRNPAAAASGVESPRIESSKVEAPPYADVLRVVAAAEGHPMHLPLAIAAYTGARRGEVLALRWSNLDGRELHVRRSLSFVGQDLRFSEPKTRNALRAVPVPDDLARILDKARAEQGARRLRLGPDWRDLDLIVDNGDGSPVHPERLTRYFGRLVTRLGVRMREHDLRHAYISELLSRGVSPLAVSRVAGHAAASFTMDRYGHLMPRDFDAVRSALSTEPLRSPLKLL